MPYKFMALVLIAIALAGCAPGGDNVDNGDNGDKPDLIPVFGLPALTSKAIQKTITVDLTNPTNYFDDLIAAQGWSAFNSELGATNQV